MCSRDSPIATSDQDLETATPLALIGRSGVRLIHAVKRTLDDINRVVLGIRVFLIVNVCKDTSLDVVARSSTQAWIVSL